MIIGGKSVFNMRNATFVFKLNFPIWIINFFYIHILTVKSIFYVKKNYFLHLVVKQHGRSFENGKITLF